MASLRATRLLSRATFGPWPGEVERLAELGPEAWLEEQLAPDGIPDDDLRERLARVEQRELRPGDLDPRPLAAQRGRLAPEERKARQQLQRRLAQRAAAGRVLRAVHSRRQLQEVMVDFWANHFSVFARKPGVAPDLERYENQVIRRHALGRFEDLLLGVARSPAMLVYLDNVRSSSPRRGRARGRRGGINENYARELMELHTLGVHGGYAQEDVVEVARALTGWSATRELPTRFVFRSRLHEPGQRLVLGARLRSAGRAQGEELLRMLARHPSTARHISRKLAVRFVDDQPAERLVEGLARVFLETGGDIARLLRSIFAAREFADPSSRKLKTPLELVASALRQTGGETDAGPPVRTALRLLGELPYSSRTPDGYPDTLGAWLDPAAMLQRMSLAFRLARDDLHGTRLGPHPPHGITASSGDEGSPNRWAVALASPEFQWQ